MLIRPKRISFGLIASFALLIPLSASAESISYSLPGRSCVGDGGVVTGGYGYNMGLRFDGCVTCPFSFATWIDGEGSGVVDSIRVYSIDPDGIYCRFRGLQYYDTGVSYNATSVQDKYVYFGGDYGLSSYYGYGIVCSQSPEGDVSNIYVNIDY